jgi:hypothetical protein
VGFEHYGNVLFIGWFTDNSDKSSLKDRQPCPNKKFYIPGVESLWHCYLQP